MKTSTVVPYLFSFALALTPNIAHAAQIQAPAAATSLVTIAQLKTGSQSDAGIASKTDGEKRGEVHNLIIRGLQRLSDLTQKFDSTPLHPSLDPKTNKLIERSTGC